MNQAMQTPVLTLLFASAVHPCRVPYAQSMPKKSREEELRLAEENFIQLLGSNIDEPIEMFYSELDTSDEEANQRFLEFFKQGLPDDVNKLLARDDEVLRVSQELSKIVSSKGQA